MNPVAPDPFAYLHTQFTKQQLRDHGTVLYGLYVSLAFGIIDAKEMIADAWDATQVILKHSDIYASIRHNGELLLDVKQFAYAQAAMMMPKFARTVKDDALATTLGTGVRNRAMRALGYAPLFNALREHLRSGRAPLAMHEIKGQLIVTLSDPQIETYAGKFINYKMAFMMKGGVKFTELLSDVMVTAYYGLLRTYPNWADEGHRLAIAKSNIHNRGHNIIKEHTAGLRKSLQGDSKSGYTAVLVPLDGFETMSGGADALYAMSKVCASFTGKSSDAEGLDWETELALKQLLQSRTLAPLQRQYLQLLVGEPSEDFSAWLGSSNTELVQTLPFHRYDERVREYLHIPAAASASFLCSLRACL